MGLTLSAGALDWALKHAIEKGDTDIFPVAFEFQAMRHGWDSLSAQLQSIDALEWKVRPSRRCLAPKHKYGFRVSTQLDPLDFIIYTALVYEIGQKLEARRVATSDKVVHSYRFSPDSNGQMFSKDWTYRSFQKESAAACSRGIKFVAIADIADFFPRISTHRSDNAIDAALGTGHMHATLLKRLINQWAGTYSFGVPVGSAASRLIAELTIADVDQSLLAERLRYVRYSDDFRFFCKTESEAYRCLALIARFLWEQHGLTLQQHKTKIVSVKKFRSTYLRENEKREVETLSERFYELMEEIGIEDPYSDIDLDSLSDGARQQIESLNLQGLLKEQLKLDDPDLSLMKFLFRRLGQVGSTDEAELVLKSLKQCVPVIQEAVHYLEQVATLAPTKKSSFGKRLLASYADQNSIAAHLEYSRMYLLEPFSLDRAWNNVSDLVTLRNEAVDEFSARKLTLALGRTGQDYWFRTRKQGLQSLGSWVRRAFIYGASCLPTDEYKHWIRGLQFQLDPLEEVVAIWARKYPISSQLP